MPMFFASNAIDPIALMPAWLAAIARITPLTSEVDALRALMLRGGVSAYGLGLDVGVRRGFTILLVIIGGRLYPTVAR